MTMPVFALLTPVAMPQPLIGGQSALTDYSEGQQQPYSEDLAALLASMEAALVVLDAEIQQLPDLAEPAGQELVQSMLPQPLLFDPLLPDPEVNGSVMAATTEPAVHVLPSEVQEVQVVPAMVPAMLPTQLASGVVLTQWSEQSIGSSVPLPLHSAQKAVTSSQSMLPLPTLSADVPAVVVAPAQQKNADVMQQNTTSFLSSFNQNLTSQLNKISSLNPAALMTELFAPATAAAPALTAATSALPVWQADPMPAQTQQWGQRLVQMLADKVDLQLGLNVKSAMIRLDPPSLGSIELSVQLDGDRLTVQMHSSNAQLREAMGQGLEQLRASLQQKLGADVQIELRMGSDSSSQQQQQKASQQLAQQLEANFHSEAEMTATESSQPNRLNLVNQLV